MAISKRSSISRLPDEVRRHIEQRLAEGGMTLDELIADLQQQFPAHQDELPSRSAVHRYGQKLERRLAAIRASTEAARIIHEQVGDRKDARSEALTAMIQAELMESIIELQEAGVEESPEKRISLLTETARSVATLTRSSVTLKKYQEEAMQRARAELLAEQKAALDALPAKAGVTDDTKDAIRQALGIV